ncbi:MAG: GNAT family N-acetyltransferase [Micrococcales bacterium]|nr:GNAT family N-acetyltransferase [Micrococcales bacterium]
MDAHKTQIRAYRPKDEDALFRLIQGEGAEWQDYWRGANRQKYAKALASSIVYLLFAGDELAGYARCRDDSGYGVYILDLLVDQKHRGLHYGQSLIEQVRGDHPGVEVYITSDVDPYYQKLGYQVVGTLFAVPRKP